MLYIYFAVLYYYGNLYVTEGAYAGGRGFPLSQRSFLLSLDWLDQNDVALDSLDQNDMGGAQLARCLQESHLRCYEDKIRTTIFYSSYNSY